MKKVIEFRLNFLAAVSVRSLEFSKKGTFTYYIFKVDQEVLIS